MGCIHRKLVVIAALAPFLAGCTAEALGPEYREISEEESGLQFYAPGLEGGYRNIIIGQDAKFIKRMVAVYGPQQGEFPRGQLVLIEMPPGRHFTRVNPPGDTIEEWGAFEYRKIVRGPTGTAVNKIGRIDYAAFQADGVACVIFRQPFGTVYDTGRGTRLLDGFYCKGEAAMMNKGEAVSIMKVIGHRKFGAVARPSGWPSATEVAVSSEAYARSAEAYARAGDYNQAIDDFAEAIRLDPRNATYYRSRGHAYRDKGNSDRAIQDYNEAIRLDPAYTRAYNSRGIAYKKRGDNDLAIRDYDEAIRLDPRYAIAYKNRGSAYRSKGDYDRANRDYDEAIRLDPAYANAYLGRGINFHEKGDNDLAIRDYSEAIRLDPAFAIAYNNRCWVYGITRRPNEALRDCNESLRLRPDNPATLDSRALVYWLLGDHDKARRDLERAHEINPRYSRWQDRFREFEGMF